MHLDLVERHYPESRFGGFTDADGTIRFYTRVNALLTQKDTVLDIGCGQGSYGDDPVGMRRNLRILKGRCRHVVGVDVDPSAENNPFLDKFELIEPGGPWPVGDGEINLCLSDWTLEHVSDTDMFFSEAQRVLARGGYLCVRTSNLLHYRSLVARIVPNAYHTRLLRTLQPRRDECDVFPTHYRCNTLWALKSKLKANGFADFCVYAIEAEPAYLNWSPILYWLGAAYQRFAPTLVRSALLAFAVKT